MIWGNRMCAVVGMARAALRFVVPLLAAIGALTGSAASVVAAPAFAYDGSGASANNMDGRTDGGSGYTSAPVHQPYVDALRRADAAGSGTTSSPTFVAPQTTRPASSPNYSVAYETSLPSPAYPGRSAEFHFSEANRSLHAAFEADPRFAADMEGLYPGIFDGVAPGPKGGFPREAPTDQLTWHHEATRPGTMQLVPRDQHIAPGPVQQSLHPGGKGGMAIWGGGR